MQDENIFDTLLVAADLNFFTIDGEAKNPLEFARSLSLQEFATKLIDRGNQVSNMDLQNIVHEALFETFLCGNEDIFDILLPVVDLSSFITVGGKEVYPLLQAIFKKRESMAIKLLQNGCLMHDVPCERGMTSLHHAIIGRMEDLVRTMIERGYNTDDSFEIEKGEIKITCTPLIMCVMFGLSEIALELIDRGCNVLTKCRGHDDALRMISLARPGHACDIRVMRRLIAEGCDLTHLNSTKIDYVYPGTCLTRAVMNDQTDIALEYINLGIGLNVINVPVGRKTALMLAIEKNNQVLVERLVEVGADLHNQEASMVKSKMTDLKASAEIMNKVLNAEDYIYDDFSKELMPFLFRCDVISSRKRNLNDDPHSSKKQKCS